MSNDKGSEARTSALQENQKISPRLKLLALIIDWDKNQAVSDAFEKEQVGFVCLSKARGTATSEILDILGVGSTDKALILSLAEGYETIPALITAVRRKLGARSAGAGIAFTVPLTGINASILRLFIDAILPTETGSQDTGEGVVLQDATQQTQKTEMGDNMDETKVEIRHNAIISILNHGYSDDFMKTAREAGARGGTVISARGLTSQKSRKFLGMSIQDEKEIIIVLTDREKSVDIMSAVSGEFGASSKAEGIVFSLPVDRVMSLNDMG